MRLALVLAYVGAIVLANWLILRFGLVPIGFGLMTPAGTYAAALVLVLRDLVQRTSGRGWSLVVIVPGIAITSIMSPQLALASGVAFALSELADFAVYTPLQRRGLALAVLVSATAGNVIDSTIFLTLAGIPLAQAWPGLVVGKMWAIVAAALIVALGTSRLARRPA